MTKVRLIVLSMTILVVSVFGYFVSFIARGYRFDIKTFKFSPNGILVAKSEPDGASIYINGELSGATNSNISLPPGSYDVEMTQSGYTTWKKRLTIEKEEVVQVTAQLFKIAPSLSPITFDGANNPIIASDYSKIAYTNKDGLWIMQVSILPIGFRNDPKQITDGDLELATYEFSPNGREILVETQQETYLLDTSNFTPQAQRVNVAGQKKQILASWQEKLAKQRVSQFKLLPPEMVEILQRRTSSFTFSPDETMVMYTASSSANLADNLIKQLPGSSTQEQERNIKEGLTYVYDIKEDRNFQVNGEHTNIYWLPTSRHIITPENDQIYIMDYDGTNKQTVFTGGYIFPYAYPFVTASELLILTSFGSDTATPNLYSLTVK
ncbi:PEGA domain-containing protein [Candidatus Microgenomates bacterium]|nr:PEGA domain-containing protein [Candidatus Microgenomates bacterium]